MNVAFIPAPSVTDGAPVDFIKYINGKPLIYWTVAAACECTDINRVFVATNSKDINKVVEGFCAADVKRFQKVRVIALPEENFVAEFAKKYNSDNIVMLKGMSPLLTGDDLESGFRAYNEKGTGSVVSVVPQRKVVWTIDENGVASASGAEIQESYVENGAFYICSKKDLLISNKCVNGKVRIALMSEDTLLSLEDPNNWNAVEELLKSRTGDNNDEIQPGIIDSPDETVLKTSAHAKKKYKMLLTDCDGCLTDSALYYSERGDELKRFNGKDGTGFDLLKEAGIVTGIITAEKVDLNRRRCEKLNVDVYAPGCKDKASCIRQLCIEYNVEPAEIVYVGTSARDVDVMQMVGLGCCPADASGKLISVAGYTTTAKGGEGVIIEIAEMLLDRGFELFE